MIRSSSSIKASPSTELKPLWNHCLQLYGIFKSKLRLAYPLSLITDPDHARAIGAVKLQSLGNLQATRKGEKVEITGKIYHTIKDTYDFNKDTFLDKTILKPYRILAEKGYAKVFQVYGAVPQAVRGTVEIKNGQIINPQFKWLDINKK